MSRVRHSLSRFPRAAVAIALQRSRAGSSRFAHLCFQAHRLPRRQSSSFTSSAGSSTNTGQLAAGSGAPVPGSAHADLFLSVVERCRCVGSAGRIRAALFSGNRPGLDPWRITSSVVENFVARVGSNSHARTRPNRCLLDQVEQLSMFPLGVFLRHASPPGAVAATIRSWRGARRPAWRREHGADFSQAWAHSNENSAWRALRISSSASIFSSRIRS